MLKPGFYMTRSGLKVEVLDYNLGGNYPMLGLVHPENAEDGDSKRPFSWSAPGIFYSGRESDLMTIIGTWEDLGPDTVPCNTPIDAPVWVRDSSLDEWLPRHFAVFRSHPADPGLPGVPLTFVNGQSSHTEDPDKARIHNQWRYGSLTKPEVA